MIITTPLGADAAVSADAGDGAMWAAQHKMTLAIINEGESVGAFIKPESVWFRVVRSDASTMEIWVRSIWSPDPAKGCQLRGGALDGHIVELERQEDGRPVQDVSFPDPGVLQVDTAPHPNPLGSTRYKRAGIDSSEDRWVYEADGEWTNGRA